MVSVKPYVSFPKPISLKFCNCRLCLSLLSSEVWLGLLFSQWKWQKLANFPEGIGKTIGDRFKFPRGHSQNHWRQIFFFLLHPKTNKKLPFSLLKWIPLFECFNNKKLIGQRKEKLPAQPGVDTCIFITKYPVTTLTLGFWQNKSALNCL